jgi:hypothetical protein
VCLVLIVMDGGGAAGGVVLLPRGAGACLDIELNISFPSGTVPASFGAVGLIVLGGESFMHVHWVAVPKTLRARRVNRRRR